MIEIEAVFRRADITFHLYGEKDVDELLIPFDIISRVIADQEWSQLTKGIEQRVKAINSFLHDIYHGQDILKANIVAIDFASGAMSYTINKLIDQGLHEFIDSFLTQNRALALLIEKDYRLCIYYDFRYLAQNSLQI